jgi:hypothetical protein
MNKKKQNNTKERIERLLEIDIYKQARRPRAEVQEELREYGIDATALAAEAMRITKDAVAETRSRLGSEQKPTPQRHGSTPTQQTKGLNQSFPRWSGRDNLPKGFEDFINSAAGIPLAQEECLALSADAPATKFWTKVWRVVEQDMRLLLSAQAHPGKLALIVTDSTGEPSRALDGAKFISTSGSEIAEIRDRSAVVDAAMLKNDFIMISPTGSPLTLKPE